MCENEGFFSSLVRDCMQLLEKIEDADSALAMAIKEMKEEFLQKALEMCDAFSYKAAAVGTARKLLKNIQKANKLIAKAMKSVDYDLLRKAVKFCESFNYQVGGGGGHWLGRPLAWWPAHELATMCVLVDGMLAWVCACVRACVGVVVSELPRVHGH